MSDEAKIWNALAEVLDPEVGIDIVSLGLVEELLVESARVHVGMIMTSAACPMHVDLTRQAEEAVRRAAGSGVEVTVAVLSEPAWTPDRMSPTARRLLGW